mmetsp:Transcript_11255/g.12076  ORF Transcript_11255/g.12076 Transcript_11255/m.12076 type:complete len:96 (+) Transcript_11255:35-322(+)
MMMRVRAYVSIIRISEASNKIGMFVCTVCVYMCILKVAPTTDTKMHEMAKSGWIEQKGKIAPESTGKGKKKDNKNRALLYCRVSTHPEERNQVLL